VKALVTGSAGFVGRHLVPKLIAAGYEVSHIDPIRHGCGYSPPSCTVEEFVKTVPEMAYDLVVHLAANIVNVDSRMKGGMSMYDDIELDLAMCRWLEKNPPKQCAVLMSSCTVDYPEDPYCIVKRNLESFAQNLHKKGVPVIVLRPFSGYGEDQSEEYPFRAILERALRKEDPLTVWGGSQVRDWIHIDDLTDGILFAIQNVKPSPDPIEVGTCRGTDFTALAVKIADACGYEPNIRCDNSKPASSSFRVAGGRTMYDGPSVRTLQKASDGRWRAKIALEVGIHRAVASRRKSEASCPA